MPEKLIILFDAEKEGNTETQKMYSRLFEIRRKKPEDFVWSAFFSAFVDAKEAKSKVFTINEDLRFGGPQLTNFVEKKV
jgi:hypothetical protein